MDYKAIIFDCDGTLADTMPPHFLAWTETLGKYGLELDEDRFYALGGWPSLNIVQLLAREKGCEMDCAAIAAEKEAAFERLLRQVEAVAPVLQVAAEWRGKLPLAVATGGVRRICEGVLEHLGIRDWFDAIVTAEDVVHHKPAPDIFLEAARRLNTPPADCLVYEDTDPGIEAARRAGMRHIDVRRLHTPRRISVS